MKQSKQGRHAKNLTLSEETVARAEQLVRAMDAGSISSLVTTLIREEFERRHGPISICEDTEAGKPTRPRMTT